MWGGKAPTGALYITWAWGIPPTMLLCCGQRPQTFPVPPKHASLQGLPAKLLNSYLNRQGRDSRSGILLLTTGRDSMNADPAPTSKAGLGRRPELPVCHLQKPGLLTKQTASSQSGRTGFLGVRACLPSGTELQRTCFPGVPERLHHKSPGSIDLYLSERPRTRPSNGAHSQPTFLHQASPSQQLTNQDSLPPKFHG